MSALLPLPKSLSINKTLPNWFLFLSFFLLCQMATLQSQKTKPDDVQGADLSESTDPLPYFELNATREINITVQKGRDIFLSCRVNLLGDKVVTWMRKDEKGSLKLLTYGLDDYGLGPRQNLSFVKPNDWRLSIKQVQITDAGQFQCQVSTHPPKILQFKLNVIAPRVLIVDDGEKPLRDKIYKTGSTLELKCIVDKMDDEISNQHVNWYHGSRNLNNDTLRGGISVKSWLRREFGHAKTSKLYIANVNASDSGHYICSLGLFGNASVFVSVLNAGAQETQQELLGTASTHLIIASSFLLPLIVLFAIPNN